MTRRTFLTGAARTIIFSIVAGVSAVAAYFMYPARQSARQLVYYDCMDEEALPKKGIKRAEYHYAQKGREITAGVYIANHNGLLYAMSPVCTHLGCLVNYNRQRNEFLCPCHGGRYDASGRVISGPPPEPLARLPVKVENGRVYVGITVPGAVAA